MRQQEEGPHKQDEDEAAVLRVPEQGCLLELETMVVEDYAKFYNHGEGKSNYLIGYKTLCLPTRPSLMTSASASQFHVYLLWVNPRLA